MSETRDSVLFAYDGSAFAKEAVQESGRRLAPCSAYVLTVWQPVEAIAMGPMGVVGAEIEKTDSELAQRAQETADEGAELAGAAGFDVTPISEPERGSVWATVISVAEDHDVGLIVLGSHGRTGISYVLKGSVATAVSQHARRPVMIVPAEPDADASDD
ncbi:MAG: universal stress protein [Thermoleophilia bacterium]|nr:universal stress protein [Thermoleophilia bacterium]